MAYIVINRMDYQFIFLVIVYGLWHMSQVFIESGSVSECEIIDNVHDFYIFRMINVYLNHNIIFTTCNFVLTSFLIDINIIYVVCCYLHNYNKMSRRTIIILILGVLLRQLCQYANRLPAPKNMIWYYPGIPSIFVTYHTYNDFFFSGHTFVAICMGTEIMSNIRWYVRLYGLLFIFYEIFFVVVTNAHYTMDIYAAVTTYFALKYFIK